MGARLSTLAEDSPPTLGLPARFTGGGPPKLGLFGLDSPFDWGRVSGSVPFDSEACRKADIRASSAGVVTRLGVRKWRTEPAGEALVEPGVDRVELGGDFEGVALVTRTLRVLGGEAGDCTLTEGGE
jgi:hypothetical protein